MTAKFDGAIEPGESLIAHCAGVWLKGVAIERFEAGPGRRSAVRIQLSEVLAGSFPSVNSFDELTLNANSWDIYRADDKSIPSPEATAHRAFIEALEIFLEAGSRYSKIFTDSGELKLNELPEKFSQDQLKRLRELGWNAVPGVGFYFYT